MSKVDDRGRIVLPPKMRHDLHIEVGASVSFEKVPEGILVRPKVPVAAVLEAMKGMLETRVEDPLAAKRMWE